MGEWGNLLVCKVVVRVVFGLKKLVILIFSYIMSNKFSNNYFLNFY